MSFSKYDSFRFNVNNKIRIKNLILLGTFKDAGCNNVFTTEGY